LAVCSSDTTGTVLRTGEILFPEKSTTFCPDGAQIMESDRLELVKYLSANGLTRLTVS
jgi:hypothetical protein